MCVVNANEEDARVDGRHSAPLPRVACPVSCGHCSPNASDEHTSDCEEGQGTDVVQITRHPLREIGSDQSSGIKACFYDSGVVSVRYCLEHIGHAVTAAALPLSRTDKECIAHYIQLGLDVPTVLRVIRKQHVDTKYRLYWITAADIRNTRSGLHLQPGRLHDDDLESLILRKGMNMDSDGMRRFDHPKEAGGRFCLVIITPEQLQLLDRYSARGVALDDTHCTTRYNLKLATVMLVDDCGRGVPGAFLLSSAMDVCACQALFEEIKKLYEEFNPKFFVTDDTMVFWNAYKTVFPSNETIKLLCAWHCQRAIFEKLNTCLPRNSEKRRLLGGWLKTLFTQCNKVEFSKAKGMLLGLLAEQRMTDSGIHAFEDYFRRYYLRREEEWAPYNRVASIANTTMICERWHRTLKYTFLGSSSNKRADELVHILIGITPILAREHLIQDARGIIEGKFRAKENCLRHKRAVEIKEYAPQKMSSNEWRVPSFDTPQKWYKLTVAACPCDTDDTHCPLCHVCPVAIACSCPDGIKSGMSCKHAHAWTIYRGNDESSQIEQQNATTEKTPFYCFPETDLPQVGRGFESEEDLSWMDLRKTIVAELQEYVDRLSYSWNTSTSADEERVSSLLRTREHIRKAVEEELGGANTPRLIPRRTCHTKNVKQRSQSKKTMSKRKSKSKSSMSSTFHTDDINTEELNICVICNDTQPPLDDPEDEEIMVGAPVLWWSCTNCRAWVHRDCMTARECIVCDKGFFEA
ncbi:unnamed protein product [Cylicocyclus nassatus]|uniref:SWIM-type domain-containing protein n=1 Tax=Cylicocyclus nassatus TaxID=53992 RepID=A0AA36DMI7_CYLNA|nr:unnamed protein product [Cylicocyclus nassatus]